MQENRHQTDMKKGTPDITLRAVIAEAYASSGLTEREFAKALRVTAATARRILSEDGLYIGKPILKRIAGVLALDYGYLIDIQPPFPAEPRLLTTAGRLEDGVRKSMIEFVKQVIDDDNDND